MNSKKQVGNYILEKKIGEGQFGEIFKSTKIKSKKIVAIKVIKKSLYQSNNQLLTQLNREIKIMKKLSHPNLMTLHEFFQSSKNYYIVMDLCPEGDLTNYMSQNKISFFKESEAILLLTHIKNGLGQLFKLNILHRDLKLVNIFVKKNHLVIGDFGTSKIFNGMTTTTVGTPINMAPEILKGMPYNHKSDMWAVGIIFYNFLFGKVPFFGFSIADLLNQILNFSGQNLKFPKNNLICNSVKSLLRKLLEPNQKKRISYNEFKQHYVFSNDHSSACFYFKSCKNSPIFKKFKLKNIQGKIIFLINQKKIKVLDQ